MTRKKIRQLEKRVVNPNKRPMFFIETRPGVYESDGQEYTEDTLPQDRPLFIIEMDGKNT